MIKNTLLVTVITFSFLAGTVAPVFADGSKSKKVDFGKCFDTKWELTQENVSANATHGVLGKNGGFAGNDKIFVSGNNVLQCLCTPEGKGYQTNWLDASKLSKDEVSVYKKDGWTVVAGANWGLKDTSYLGKTTEYTCKEHPKIAGFAKTGVFEDNLANFVAFFGVLSMVLGLVSYKRFKRSL